MSIKSYFLNSIKQSAQKSQSNILLPEAHLSSEILQAGLIFAKNKLGFITLLSKPNQEKDLIHQIKSHHTKIPDNLNIIDPATFHLSMDFFAQQYQQIRSNKPISISESLNQIQSIYYYSPLLLKNDLVDGIVTGYVCPTKESIVPAFQILKKPNQPTFASSYFLMIHQQRLMMFADCAINVDPNANELSQIALDTAKNAEKLGIKPKIAFLSFSTNQSSPHPLNQKIIEATKITKDFIQTNQLNYEAEGDIQVDAALIEEIGEKKFPNNSLKGQANIFIFPNLFAGNISYKMLERLGKTEALGPIIQGLSHPFNDLSRGASIEDITNVITLTAVEASKSH